MWIYFLINADDQDSIIGVLFSPLVVVRHNMFVVTKELTTYVDTNVM